MSAPEVTFDAELHEYTVDGDRYPSVTEILRDLSAREYRFVDKAVMEDAAWLGTAVHLLIELDIAGTLDEAGLDERLVPYLEKWREFRAQSGFQPLLSEQRVFSTRYRYAGTLDLFGTLNGRFALIDAKRCAKVPRTAGPQTAGYEMALRERFPDLIKSTDMVPRFALQLTPDRWQLLPLTGSADSRLFLSALNLFHWSNQA